MKKLLFVCTGNSCRSQMAEGLGRQLLDGQYEVFSAGTRPSFVHPKAIAVMREIGIDISAQRSKSVQEFAGRTFDIIITVCDSAKEACPAFPGKAKRLHWSFKDPAAATGREDEILGVFRKVRDQIQSKIRLELGD